VLKIEPQAQVQQNVTMFPVLVNIENPGHLLKPGMNTEVEIHVGDRRDVLAVPNAALRTARDVASAASVLGLDPQVVQEELAQSPAAPPADSGGAAMGGGGAMSDRTPPRASDTSKTKAPSNVLTMPDGRQITLPSGVTAEQVQTIFAKRRSGQQLTAAEQATMRQVFSQFRGGPGGGMRNRGNGNAGGSSNNYIVFVLRNGKPTAVNIRTGLTDLDYSEVLSGLTAQDTVLLLPSASLVQAQQSFKERIQNFTGGGLPGLRQQSGGTSKSPQGR
jgi:HlyD family secretion protein